MTKARRFSFRLDLCPKSLEAYLKEPEIEIDNNLVDNAIRPNLGKKNW